MFSPSAIAIVNNSNCPLLIRTLLDNIDGNEASKLTYLLHVSLDIVDEKVAQPTSRDNFLGILYQCEQFKIYGYITTTKIKIISLISQRLITPRENDIRQLLKNIQKIYIEATAMNPFYELNKPVKSKRLDNYLSTILNPTPSPNPNPILANADISAIASDEIRSEAPSFLHNTLHIK